LIEGYGIAFELFGVPGHGGRLPFFPARLGWISGVHHMGVRSPDQMTVLNKDMALGKYEARGVEQHLIEKLGMQKPTGATTKVGNLENKINSMSPKHEFYDQATAFGKDWVDQFASKVR
ncbi:hypothetical protein ACN4EA_09975, partial [Corynebacterium macclintockiae]|uniref:hypothetical protein n=1 Tax=Corynebacterium macclintockiae TaxID=2913501 RepID=UPI003EB94067